MDPTTTSTSTTTSVKRVKRIEKAFVKLTTAAPAAAPQEQPSTSDEMEEYKHKAVASAQAATKQLNYEKLSLHDQILLRPDTYIGSVKTVSSTDAVWTLAANDTTEEPQQQDNDDAKMSDDEQPTPRTASSFVIRKEFVPINDGLLRIFIEVLSNAIDNVWRSLQAQVVPKFIKVDISKSCVKVWNDGRNIPIALHETEKIPIPELIFGNLLTSSNYNDAEERKTSGRNGYGVKLSNIFSKRFKLTVFNRDEGVVYTQEWRDNMKIKDSPSLARKGFPKTVEDGKNGFTCVEFEPDFARFGCTEFSEEMQRVLSKFVYDAAMTVSINKVQVMLNGSIVPVSKLTDYVNMYFTVPPKNVMSLQSSDSYVVLAPAKEWTCVSFVNGIFTRDGGVHVDKWLEALFRPVLDKLNSGGGNKKPLDMRDIKKHFFVFVFADLDKPSFDTQSKHKLNGPAVTVDVKPTHIQKLLKWDFVQQIEESQKLKDMLTFQKETERRKGQGKIEKLEDANWAGKPGKSCVLCLCEGDSAKTYVVSGMKYGMQGFKGRDQIGVMPLRGKFVNVKNASSTLLVKNKELIAITRTLGVQYGVDYTVDENFNKLRYKKLLSVCDADVDGFHITGLLLNLFHTLYPTLLQRKGFFGFLRIPIIKVMQGPKKLPLSFYYQQQALDYIAANKVASKDVKYFKGLGTGQETDVKQDFGKRIVHFVKDEQADKMMDQVFGSEESDFRKRWLMEYKPMTTYPVIADGQIEDLSVSNFLNLEMINYSIDHCRRAIPSLVDGLKESSRKVLFGAFKKGLKYSGEAMKVAQFANYVADVTHYHHGEKNLQETITKMAQRFVGSNNLPLLYNAGMFGSRSEYGNDAADGRYIFTKLDSVSSLLFRQEDEPYLTTRYDDGAAIEPEVYVPVIPLVVVNGVQGGIGTGWSSTIPPHNIKDVVGWIKAWLNQQELPVLVPFFRGFKGTVKVEGNKVITQGLFHEDKKRYVVTEIPVGRRMLSISKFKEKLEDLEEADVLKSIDNQSTENQVSYSFLWNKPEVPPTYEKLGLLDSTFTSNMVLYNAEGKLVKYKSVQDIMEDWCEVRFKQYNVRKEGTLKTLQHECKIMYNKVRFIEMVLADKIVLKDKDEEVIVAELEQHKFDKVPDYDYLLNLSVRQLTKKNLGELKSKYEKTLEQSKMIADTPIKVLWERELDELLKGYDKWVAEQQLM